MAFPSRTVLYLGDIILNLLIVASGLILFALGVLYWCQFAGGCA